MNILYIALITGCFYASATIASEQLELQQEQEQKENRWKKLADEVDEKEKQWLRGDDSQRTYYTFFHDKHEKLQSCIDQALSPLLLKHECSVPENVSTSTQSKLLRFAHKISSKQAEQGRAFLAYQIAFDLRRHEEALSPENISSIVYNSMIALKTQFPTRRWETLCSEFGALMPSERVDFECAIYAAGQRYTRAQLKRVAADLTASAKMYYKLVPQ